MDRRLIGEGAGIYIYICGLSGAYRTLRRCRFQLGHGGGGETESEIETMRAKAKMARGVFGCQAGAAAGKRGPGGRAGGRAGPKRAQVEALEGGSSKPAGGLGRGERTMDREEEIERAGSRWLG